jgi:hypothetical protein
VNMTPPVLFLKHDWPAQINEFTAVRYEREYKDS